MYFIMALNKQSGNMYGFVTHTWNAIKGKCMHDCAYCYMKRFPQKDLWLDEKEFKTNLGEGNFIFIGSSCDMFADNVPKEWIEKVLTHCKAHKKNTYLFQTKNTKRFEDFVSDFQEICIDNDVVIGTTVETNREYEISKAPNPFQRLRALQFFPDWRIMITLEPIFEFDLDNLVAMIKSVKPEWVNVGADSNNKKEYNFPEPSKEKILKLVEELSKFTKVINKENLGRLLK